METHDTILVQLATPPAVTLIQDWLQNHPDGHRSGLSQHVCESLALRDACGQPRMAGVQKALRVLERRGLWRLPTAHSGPKSGSQKARRLEQPVEHPRNVPSRVDEIRGLRLVLVAKGDDASFRIWNELMLGEHPLRDARLVGRQVRYLIDSDHGYLGGIGFGSSALRLEVRDRWIGWDPTLRSRFQAQVVNMARFLIRPSVRCDNLASHVLALCMRRLAADFSTRYGFEPWLAETFVDTEAYDGGCYRAANWQHLGASKGRGRNGRTGLVKTIKDVYVYPLRKDWRRAMGLPAACDGLASVALEEALNSDRWIDDEFGAVDLGHQDTEQRLAQIVRSRAENPGASYAQCFAGDRHQLKAYYRFIGHRRECITPDSILEGHRNRTLGRMKGQSRVLVIQDTSDLDFSERLHCNGLGDIGKNQTGAVSHGLKMHSALAVGEDGVPLGVLRLSIYASHYGGGLDGPDHRSIEEKESHRWLETVQDLGQVSELLPETEMICVSDREGDIFELFDCRRRQARSVHLLVRAKHNRCLDGGGPKLFDHLDRLPVMAEAAIEVPRQREKKGKPSKPGRPSMPARTAQVQVKWAKVTLLAPDTEHTRDLPSAEVYAVSIVEPNAPSGSTPLQWVLLTTSPVESRKQALRCVRWYTKRWRIEEWHRVLKSGCNIESHQHRTADRLARAIAIDAVIAWRAMLLTLLSRESPEMPCDMVFSSLECRLLESIQPRLAPESSDQKKT